MYIPLERCAGKRDTEKRRAAKIDRTGDGRALETGLWHGRMRAVTTREEIKDLIERLRGDSRALKVERQVLVAYAFERSRARLVSQVNQARRRVRESTPVATFVVAFLHVCTDRRLAV